VECVLARIQVLKLCMDLSSRIASCFELGIDFIMASKTDKRINKVPEAV
jgi:hypothetical protein